MVSCLLPLSCFIPLLCAKVLNGVADGASRDLHLSLSTASLPSPDQAARGSLLAARADAAAVNLQVTAAADVAARIPRDAAAGCGESSGLPSLAEGTPPAAAAALETEAHIAEAANSSPPTDASSSHPTDTSSSHPTDTSSYAPDTSAYGYRDTSAYAPGLSPLMKVLSNIYRKAAEYAQPAMDNELTEVAALTKALKLPPVSDCNDGEQANDCVTIHNDALFRRIKDKRVIGETIKAKLRTMKRLVDHNKVVPKMVARIKVRAMQQPLCNLLSKVTATPETATHCTGPFEGPALDASLQYQMFELFTNEDYWTIDSTGKSRERMKEKQLFWIEDSLRYQFVFDQKGYVEQVKHVIGTLEREWKKGKPYFQGARSNWDTNSIHRGVTIYHKKFVNVKLPEIEISDVGSEVNWDEWKRTGLLKFPKECTEWKEGSGKKFKKDCKEWKESNGTSIYLPLIIETQLHTPESLKHQRAVRKLFHDPSLQTRNYTCDLFKLCQNAEHLDAAIGAAATLREDITQKREAHDAKSLWQKIKWMRQKETFDLGKTDDVCEAFAGEKKAVYQKHCTDPKHPPTLQAPEALQALEKSESLQDSFSALAELGSTFGISNL